MIQIRTALQWLDEQNINPEAEVWALTDTTVQPVTAILSSPNGDMDVITRNVWSMPPPNPLTYRAALDTIIGSHSGGGTLKLRGCHHTYRGSYVVNPDNAVFLLFLPQHIEISDTHTDKMQAKKEAAKLLTQEIEINGK